MVFIYLVISAVIGVVLGILYNRLLSKFFSGGQRTTFCVLTMIFFIVGAVSVSAILITQSYLNSKIRNYSAMVDRYVSDAYSDNEFVKNGINLSQINDGVLQVSNLIADIKTIIPSPEELNVDKKVYGMFVDYLTKELQNRLNAVANTVDNHATRGNILVNKNGNITASSILSFVTDMLVRQVRAASLGMIMIVVIPLVIYVAVTVILAVVKAASDKRKKEAGGG